MHCEALRHSADLAEARREKLLAQTEELWNLLEVARVAGEAHSTAPVWDSSAYVFRAFQRGVRQTEELRVLLDIAKEKLEEGKTVPTKMRDSIQDLLESTRVFERTAHACTEWATRIVCDFLAAPEGKTQRVPLETDRVAFCDALLCAIKNVDAVALRALSAHPLFSDASFYDADTWCPKDADLNLNARNADGCTVLMLAVCLQASELVAALLQLHEEHHLDISLTDGVRRWDDRSRPDQPRGYTALQLAKTMRIPNSRIIALLEDRTRL